MKIQICDIFIEKYLEMHMVKIKNIEKLGFIFIIQVNIEVLKIVFTIQNLVYINKLP